MTQYINENYYHLSDLPRLSPSHPDTLVSLHNLASVLQLQRKSVEAHQIYNEVYLLRDEVGRWTCNLTVTKCVRQICSGMMQGVHIVLLQLKLSAQVG